MEIGEELKQARKEKNLSLDNIEESTKIRKKYLKAIEEENFEVIPGKIYVKSFIRTYGNYLDLNGKKLAQQYENRLIEQRQLLEEKQQEIDETSFFEKYKILIISLLILGIIIGTLLFYVYYLEGSYIQNFQGDSIIQSSQFNEVGKELKDYI
ncbi:MAG: helix-turn-helix domain-containing protein [Halanaerobiaceae bacterium]